MGADRKPAKGCRGETEPTLTDGTWGGMGTVGTHLPSLLPSGGRRDGLETAELAEWPDSSAPFSGSGTLSCVRRCSCLRRLSTEGQSLGRHSAQEPARLLSDRAQAAYFEGQRQWWFVFLDLLIPGFSAGALSLGGQIRTEYACHGCQAPGGMHFSPWSAPCLCEG